MLPKVNSKDDIIKVENAVFKMEKQNSTKKKVGFELIIETAQGLMNVNSIASASKRIESLHFWSWRFCSLYRSKKL